MSETTLRRLSELALIAIASVWGLTFVMVQDAIQELPTMAFLAYRFIPASLIVAVIFRRQLRALPADGWRAGLVMGVFLTGGYIFQTLGLEQTTVSPEICSLSTVLNFFTFFRDSSSSVM